MSRKFNLIQRETKLRYLLKWLGILNFEASYKHDLILFCNELLQGFCFVLFAWDELVN